MSIEHIEIDDLKFKSMVQTELSLDVLLEKVLLIAAAQFSIAVEIKFIVSKGSIDYFMLESKS